MVQASPLPGKEKSQSPERVLVHLSVKEELYNLKEFLEKISNIDKQRHVWIS